MVLQFKKFDKVLFLIFFALVATTYALYYGGVKQTTIQSTNKAKSIFYTTKIADKIKTMQPIFKDSCDTMFWIANYARDHVVVDLCKYPELQSVQIGDLIHKEENSSYCTIIDADGKQTTVNLRIEY